MRAKPGNKVKQEIKINRKYKDPITVYLTADEINAMTFPSGLSIGDAKQEAKNLVESKAFRSRILALHNIAQREIGKNWDAVISLLCNTHYVEN